MNNSNAPKSKKRKLDDDILEIKSELNNIKSEIQNNTSKIRKINNFIDKSKLRNIRNEVDDINENMNYLEDNIIGIEEIVNNIESSNNKRYNLRNKKKYKDDNYDSEDYSDEEDDEEGNEKSRKDLYPIELEDLLDDDEFGEDMFELGKVIHNKIMDSKLRFYLPKKYSLKKLKEKNISSNNIKKEMKIVDKFINLMDLDNKNDNNIFILDHFLNLSSESKKEYIEQISKINEKKKSEIPRYFKVLNCDLPNVHKNMILDKLKMNESSDDSDKLKFNLWFDSLFNIPWGNYSKININNKASSSKISDYLVNARNCMNKVVHGQEKTKDHIIQIISKMISNPEKSNNVFAIYGPPGTGKTTIIKEGMSKALGIPFAFISLGGTQDSSHLDGHDMTYVGSKHGKIVEVIKQSGTMNPIFYFDELDKVSKCHKGEEIINLLIHLTDPSQNSLFQDKYFGSIPIDLSKAIFVFSFNNINSVNPILLDRMELIKVDKFTKDEKVIITRDYIIPEILNNYNINKNDIIFDDKIINYIINLQSNNHNGEDEGGIRNIKRRVENIISKLNVLMLTKKKIKGVHSNLNHINKVEELNFPLNVTSELVQGLVNVVKQDLPFNMYS